MESVPYPLAFGEWIKHRRKELDLTQLELAQIAGCSVTALRKIEAGVRRPSKQLAGLIAQALEIPPADQPAFIRVARGELSSERLRVPTPAPLDDKPAIPEPSLPRNDFSGGLTPFLGREAELAALQRLLEDPGCRLVTLTGPGGIGKTRLALEEAGRIQGLYPDGIWFVPLAPLKSTDFLVQAIADALNLRSQDQTEPRIQLRRHLQGKQALLVLDNFEHLLDGAVVLAEILEYAPGIKLLVTSRERLNLHLEWVFEIQGLPVPADQHIVDSEEYSSVALFLQSARRAATGFHLEGDDLTSVVRICQLVEGMPLGIELAAAWVRVLSSREIAQEIERNIDFLAVSARNLPERHRSLRATLDYSWRRISEEEQKILSRLSVFQGSFDKEAAKDVCDANIWELSSLRDKSLLRHTGGGLYDIHELIRQYAAGKLASDPGEEEQVKHQHALYYIRRLTEWEIMLKGNRQIVALSEMAEVIDDLRLVWHRVIASLGIQRPDNRFFTVSQFHHSLFSLSQFFEQRCRNWEAAKLFEQSAVSLRAIRDACTDPAHQWRLDAALGLLTTYLGLHCSITRNHARARGFMVEGQELLQDQRARGFNAQATIMFAWVYHQQGEIQKAISYYERSLVVLREEIDLWWYTLNLGLLARSYLALGRIAESLPLIEEGLQLVDQENVRLRSPLLNAKGQAAFLQGDYAGAESILQEYIRAASQLGNQRTLAIAYLDSGRVAMADGRIDLAEERMRQALELWGELGETHEYAISLIHYGKCQTAQGKKQAASENFVRAIQIGKTLDLFYVVYWGLVHLAGLSLDDGQVEKVLETALILRAFSVEFVMIQADYTCLWEAIRNKVSPELIETAEASLSSRSIDDIVDQWIS